MGSLNGLLIAFSYTGGNVKVRITPSSVILQLTEADTYEWAHREGMVWPGSVLSGNSLTAEFDRNGLCDLHTSVEDCTSMVTELNAICSDYLKTRLPEDHPAYAVAVQQFDHKGSIHPM